MVHRNVPLARQVILEILSAIEAQSIVGPSGQMPSEDELSQRFGVSRGTVREALSELEMAGLIVRRHGAGTYINPKLNDHPASIQAWFDEAGAFMDMIQRSHREASCRVLETGTLPAGDTARSLGTGIGDPVVYIEKVLYSSSTPVIHCVNYVPLRLLSADLADRAAALYRAAETTYRFVEQYCRCLVHHQESEITAVEAEGRIAALLECKVGAALLRVEEVGYTADLMPVFYGVTHFRGDLVRFRQSRRPSVVDIVPVSSTVVQPSD